MNAKHKLTIARRNRYMKQHTFSVELVYPFGFKCLEILADQLDITSDTKLGCVVNSYWSSQQA